MYRGEERKGVHPSVVAVLCIYCVAAGWTAGAGTGASNLLAGPAEVAPVAVWPGPPAKNSAATSARNVLLMVIAHESTSFRSLLDW